MKDIHRIVIEVDDGRYDALRAEAARLQIEVEQLIERATAAWLVDMNECRGALPVQPALALASVG